jgi:tocopherol cyclase
MSGNIWKPAVYHGSHKMKGYFEGWYFKLADSGERNVIAIIPGISFSEDGADAHAFIQVIDSGGKTGKYIKYNINDFSYSKKDFQIYIGPNYFSSQKVVVDIENELINFTGELTFQNLKPWPIKLLSPGVMGWYAFVPFMQCYHGVLSFDHSIEGSLRINGRNIDFTGGRGYMEKDWGTSFPRYHIWIQTNHLDTIGSSLMVSIANIPWFGNYFDGFIAGFYHDDYLYKFATYTGARLTALDHEKDRLAVQITSKKYRLSISAIIPEGTELRAPVLGDMKGRLSESLQSNVSVSLFEKGHNKETIIFQGTGRHAGLEISGKAEDIATIKVKP